MVELEARALEALDEITPPRTDLVLVGSPQLATITSDPVALISNVDFS